MDFAELEGLAEWAYRAARLPDDVPAPGIELLRRLVGAAPVISSVATGARLARAPDGGWVVYLPAGRWPTVRVRWLIAHELAEWLLERDGYRGADVEMVADALAARLIAPWRAVREAVRWGLELPEVAEAFGSTQSCALLRQGEVTGTPTALVTPERVYVRGSEWGWPDERSVRALASSERPGIVRVRIADARRRVGLVVS